MKLSTAQSRVPNEETPHSQRPSSTQSTLDAKPAGSSAAAGMKRYVGMFLYGFLFTLILPLGLLTWAHAAAPNVLLPPVRAVWLGAAVALLGGLLLGWGMFSLWIFGHGLPMSPYPPSRYVAQGAYRLMPHPIYVGFCMLSVGVALASGSAAGLWLVCSVVLLSCAALVLGYENIELHKRFAGPLPEPLLRIPADVEGPPVIADSLSLYVLVLLPWLALYELLASAGVPLDAVSGFLPFEKQLPVVEWTEALYGLTYILVGLVPWVAATKRSLREFAIEGIIATILMVLFFGTIPVIAPPRQFTPHTFLGELLAQERRLDTPANAFPAYHVFWILLAISVFAGRMPRWRYAWWCLGVAMSLSCVATGMHAAVDVCAGALLFCTVKNRGLLWQFARGAAERLANSWKEWHFGSLRIINHGLYAGMGAGLAVAIVGFLTGPQHWTSVLFVASVALVAAGLWAQFVEGSPRLLRPYGYYGGMLGIILGSLLAGPLFGTNPWLLLAAYSVAGPWVQSFGRLRCLVQGCCHGRQAPAAIGIIYRHPRSRVCRLAGLQGVPIHPTPLYSILWNVVVAMVMTRLWLVHAPLAIIGGLYLILTGVGRFVEEAYRGEPQTRWIAGLRLYQWLAVASVLAGAAVTCAQTQSAPAAANLSLLTIGTAVAFGVVTWFALGVDFPDSNRRFARLA